MTEPSEDRERLVKGLAEALGVELQNNYKASAAPGKPGKVVGINGLLSAVLDADSGSVKIKSKRDAGVLVKLVDPDNPGLAPEGAIFEISAYEESDNLVDSTTHLNGVTSSTYIGKDGPMFSETNYKEIEVAINARGK